MEEKVKQRWFFLIYFLVYLAQAFSFCLMVTYLISLGYSATERSIMFAFGAITGIIVQFWFGYLCDKNKTIKRYINYSYICYSLMTLVVYMTGFRNFFMHILLVGTMQIFFRVNIGLVDSWVLESGDYLKDNFGSMRAFGSLGWVVGSYFVSCMVEKVGYSYIGIVFASILLIAYFVGKKIPDAQKQQSVKLKLSDVNILFKNKRYILLIVILFAIYMVQTSLDYVLPDKLNALNATETEVSYYWMITGLVELPLFFAGNKLAKKYGYVNLMILSIVVYGARFVMYSLSTSILQVMLISLLQFFTFPIMQVVSKQLVDKESPENLKSSGQQIGSALYNCTSALFSPLLAGILEDSFDIDVALLAISGFALISLLLTFVYKKKQVEA